MIQNNFTSQSPMSPRMIIKNILNSFLVNDLSENINDTLYQNTNCFCGIHGVDLLFVFVLLLQAMKEQTP